MADTTISGAGYTLTLPEDKSKKAKLVINGEHLQLKKDGIKTAKGLEISSDGQGLSLTTVAFKGESPDQFSPNGQTSELNEPLLLTELGAGLDVQGPVVLGDFKQPGEGGQFGLSISGTQGNDVFMINGNLEGFSVENKLKIDSGAGDDTVIVTRKAETTVFDAEAKAYGSYNGKPKSQEPHTVVIDLGDGEDTIVSQGISNSFKASVSNLENIN